MFASMILIFPRVRVEIIVGVVVPVEGGANISICNCHPQCFLSVTHSIFFCLNISNYVSLFSFASG